MRRSWPAGTARIGLVVPTPVLGAVVIVLTNLDRAHWSWWIFGTVVVLSRVISIGWPSPRTEPSDGRASLSPLSGAGSRHKPI